MRRSIAGLAVALAACSRATPSGRPHEDGERTAAPLPPPSASAAPARASASAEPPPAAGLWATCDDGFRATSSPARDVLRLATLCGPPNGQRKKLARDEARLGPEGTEVPVELREGECLRAFVVADEPVTALDVALADPAGSLVASERTEARWATFRRDQPVCATKRGTHTLRVSAAGAAPATIQVWSLR